MVAEVSLGLGGRPCLYFRTRLYMETVGFFVTRLTGLWVIQRENGDGVVHLIVEACFL